MSVRRLAAHQPDSFVFTPENLAWAQAQIVKYPAGKQASAVIPLLWKAQAQNDYWLPRAAIEAVAAMLGMASIRVLEVATFYTMFNLEPVGRHFVQLCGTVPCHVMGALELKAVCERRIGDQRQVSADGKFAWLEVECLGACCNAPMVQINDDYYEDLTPESFEILLDDLAAGRPVRTGSQVGRVSSEAVAGQGGTLTEPTLFDGSRVGAWRKRFEQIDAEPKTLSPASVPTAAAAVGPAPTQQAKPERPTAGAPEMTAASAPSEAVDAGSTAPAAKSNDALAPAQAAPTRTEVRLPDAPEAGTDASRPSGPAATQPSLIPADPQPAAVAGREATAAREEAEIKAKLATLDRNATPEQKADAVGRRPTGLAAPRAGAPDDLKRVKGIGPVNEAKLNALGVFHYDQIAGWSQDEVRWAGTYLAFPGRIDREGWVEQARAIAVRDGSRG